MNRKTFSIVIASTTITSLVAGLMLGRFASGSFNHSSAVSPARVSQSETSTTHHAHADNPTIWTCSMHPQIQQNQPGDCPICGMDLIPLHTDTTAEPDQNPRTLSMTANARALAQIETSPVQRIFPETKIRLVGQLTYDETRERSLTARFPARIDQLYVNYTGIAVKTGEHLARIYSPELLTAQKELLSAHRIDPEGLIARAGREKLRLWDLLPQQIDRLLQGTDVSDDFELQAPMSGIVVQKNIKEGDYVQTGEVLFKIVDLDTLWATLQAYESDLSWLRFGQEVTFSVQAFPGETFRGRIAFIDPEVDSSTRTITIRVNVPNPELRLKPGMFTRATVTVRLAEKGVVFAPEFAGKWISPMHPEIIKDAPGTCDVCGMDLVPAESLGYQVSSDATPPLVIPASAVMQTGKRAVVYVEISDRDRPTFEGREVQLGPRAGDQFVVLQGLLPGDRVVTHGAFKIDSALQIQAKPSMMNPSADMESETDTLIPGDPASDPHPTQSTAGLHPTNTTGASEGFPIPHLLPLYFQLQTSLAGDDLAAAKSALSAMMQITDHQGALPELLHRMLAAADLEAIRRPDFETLSNAFITAVHNDTGEFEGPLYLMHCPMVYHDRGADWLQATESLQNPYFGAMMLTCGEVKEFLPQTPKASVSTHE